MGPQIFAHRTGQGIAPGNSFMGLKKCLEVTVDGAECDVTFSKDGKGVVWVDSMNRFLRSPSGQIPQISEMNLDQILELERTDCREKIMTLEDIWQFIENNSDIKIFFDVKNKGGSIIEHLGDAFAHFKDIPEEIINLADREIIQPAIEKNICHRIGFVTFQGGVKILRLAKEKNSQISTHLILIFPWLGKFPGDNIDDYWQYLDSLVIGWKSFNQWRRIYPKRILGKIIKKAKDNNVEISGGTANKRDDIQWAIDQEFDSIWTDDPLGILPSLIIGLFEKTRERKKRRKK